MAQAVERILGKDEVTSSTLVISSKKAFAFLQMLFLFYSHYIFIYISSSKCYNQDINTY